MDIGTTTGLSHLLTHLLVQGRHDGVTGSVLHIVTRAGNGNRCTIHRADAQHIDSHTHILRGLSSLNGPTLMVLTIGDDDDCLTDTFFLGETVRSHLNGTGNISTLCGHHRGINAGKKHLGRHIVAGDGKLYEGIASKHNQTNLIVGEMIYQVLYHHLTTVQTTGHHILGQHRVTDIHRDDGLNTHPLLMTDLRTHLGTGQHDDQQGKGSKQQPELHRGTETRHIGHQLLQQFRFAKLTKPLPLVPVRDESDECQYGNQHQQIEIYRVFKSKHYGILLKMVMRSRISSNRAKTATRAKGW